MGGLGKVIVLGADVRFEDEPAGIGASATVVVVVTIAGGLGCGFMSSWIGLGVRLICCGFFTCIGCSLGASKGWVGS